MTNSVAKPKRARLAAALAVLAVLSGLGIWAFAVELIINLSLV